MVPVAKPHHSAYRHQKPKIKEKRRCAQDRDCQQNLAYIVRNAAGDAHSDEADAPSAIQQAHDG